METTANKLSPAASVGKILFKVAGNIVFALFFILMTVLVFFLLQNRLAGGVPTVAGYQLYIVLGGSMSPAFEAGSIVFVHPVDASALRPGDIITYRDQEDSDTIVTHRVVAVYSEDPLSFTTRGDANDANDPQPVSAGNLIGRVSYSVPYLGYLFNFIKTKTGLLLLVIVPGILIIVSELRKLFSYATALEEKEKKGGIIG